MSLLPKSRICPTKNRGCLFQTCHPALKNFVICSAPAPWASHLPEAAPPALHMPRSARWMGTGHWRPTTPRPPAAAWCRRSSWRSRNQRGWSRWRSVEHNHLAPLELEGWGWLTILQRWSWWFFIVGDFLLISLLSVLHPDSNILSYLIYRYSFSC